MKNQFRALNDDEVDFLDSQVDAKIAKERAIQQENSEQLRLFRQRQDATYADIIDAIADEKDPQKPAAIEMDTNWTTSKKRKRDKEKEVIKGVKIRRNPSNIIREDDPVMSSARHSSSHGKSRLTPASPASKLENSSQNSVPATKREGPRLVTYDSDDEDD